MQKGIVRSTFAGLLMFFVFALAFSGCDASNDLPIEAIMPYGSVDYEDGTWTTDTLLEHFESLGFKDIEVEINTTFDTEMIGISEVRVELASSESWFDYFSSHRRIIKGETITTDREIRIVAYTTTPVLTVANCEEFRAITEANENDAYDALKRFLLNHNSEYLEFDGTVVEWGRPTENSKGLYMHVAIEDSNAKLYKNGVKWDDLGMDYSSGLNVGAKVHIVGFIKDGEIRIHSTTIVVPAENTSETLPNNTGSNTTDSKDNENISSSSQERDYILNISTKKFHRLGCSYISKMSDANKKTYTGTREELIEKGYEACSKCNP